MRQLVQKRPVTMGIAIGLIATLIFVASSIAAYNNKRATISSTQANVVVTQYAHYTDPQGILHYVGEVQNSGNVPATSVNVALTLKDASGTLLGWGSDGGSAGALVDMTIAPGQKVGFNIPVENTPTKPTTADLVVSAQVANINTFDPIKDATNLSVVSDTIAAGQSGYMVSGQVKNGAATDCLPVHVVVTGYDSSGKVVDVADGNTVNSTVIPAGQSQPFNGIPAGQSLPFEITLLRVGNITKYSIALHAYQK